MPVDPLSALGGVAAGLQLLQQFYQLGDRILAKPKDTKSIKAIRDDAHAYILTLDTCLGQMEGQGKVVGNTLCQTLQAIVNEIDGLKERKFGAKFITALKLYSPEFQKKLTKALEDFKFSMCIEANMKSAFADKMLVEVTEKLKKLEITRETLKELGAEESISKVEDQIRNLSQRIMDIQSVMAKVQEALSEFQSTQTLISDMTRRIENEIVSTRDMIAESVIPRLDVSESMTRISAEILAHPERITWHNDAANPPPFRVWSLDSKSLEDEPSAHFEGIALTSTTSAQAVDDIIHKRLAADDFDQNLADETPSAKRYLPLRYPHKTRWIF
jgi:hypothetical protein